MASYFDGRTIYMEPVPYIQKGLKVPIQVIHGDCARKNNTATVTKCWPQILYMDVCYVEYYKSVALVLVSDVIIAVQGGQPIIWPNPVPMDAPAARAKRRVRDKKRRRKSTPEI